jgi:hypothetical protein
MTSIHIREGNLLYSKSTDFNVNHIFKNTFPTPLDQYLTKTSRHQSLAKLTHKISHPREKKCPQAAHQTLKPSSVLGICKLTHLGAFLSGVFHPYFPSRKCLGKIPTFAGQPKKKIDSHHCMKGSQGQE